MKIHLPKRADGYYIFGLFLLLFSIALFWYSSVVGRAEEWTEAMFVFNGIICVLYSFVRWMDRDSINTAMKEQHRSVQLNLLLTTAFALNRNLAVFQQLADWYAIAIVAISIHMLLIPFWGVLPRMLRTLMSLFNGVAIVIYVYTIIPTIKYYPIGIAGTLALGIGALIFVPLLITIHLIRFQRRMNRKRRLYSILALVGAVASITFAMCYLVQWMNSKQRLETWVAEAQSSREQLPDWIKIIRKAGSGKDIRWILGSEQSSKSKGSVFEFDIPVSEINSGDQHDPLVEIALVLFGYTNMPFELKRELLNYFDDERTVREEQLWSSANLRTDSIETKLTIWPACQMAYTEKTVVVSKEGRSGRAELPGEAIYNLQLPEGAVLSSLSLWVDGKEEFSRSATRQRAESAYRTIVGVERRDPALVEWNEGNRISIRVFPVPNCESRKFRIGFSSILRNEKGKLVYTDPKLQGPTTKSAVEKTEILLEDQAGTVNMPARFASLGKTSYHYQGAYQPGWEIRVADAALAPCAYRFGNESYYLDAYHPQTRGAEINSIYLDLHQFWNKEEVLLILEAAGTVPVYAVSKQRIRLTKNNLDEHWQYWRKLSFCMLPLAQIADPSNALIVYKPANGKVELKDLKETDWYLELKRLRQKGELKLFNIGVSVEPLIRTLRELRIIQYESGSVQQLAEWVRNGRHSVTAEDSSAVVLHEAGLLIRKTAAPLPVSGPDHIVRLFQFNDILRQSDSTLLDTVADNSKLAEAARQAHILTPYSSLIVLESNKDYDRFEIDNIAETLGNASFSKAGAAPEPEEWALLLAALFVAVFLLKRKYKRNQST